VASSYSIILADSNVVAVSTLRYNESGITMLQLVTSNCSLGSPFETMTGRDRLLPPVSLVREWIGPHNAEISCPSMERLVKKRRCGMQHCNVTQLATCSHEDDITFRTWKGVV
jgi:hypothetical protein